MNLGGTPFGPVQGPAVCQALEYLRTYGGHRAPGGGLPGGGGVVVLPRELMHLPLGLLDQYDSGAQFKTYQLFYFWKFPFNISGPQLTIETGKQNHEQEGTTIPNE